MNPVLKIFGFEVYTYNAFAFFGAIIGSTISWWHLRKLKLKNIDVIHLLLNMNFSFLIGARILNVIINFKSYQNINDMFALSMRGLSLYGGFAGAFVALFHFIYKHKLNAYVVLDQFVYGSGVAFILARIGCFLNGCCAGKATSSIFGVEFITKKQYQDQVSSIIPLTFNFRLHPTQIYELLGVSFFLILIYFISKKKRLKSGSLFLLFGSSFSLVRLVVLPLRALVYPSIIKHVFYPFLYMSTILIGMILWVINEKSTMKIQGKNKEK